MAAILSRTYSWFDRTILELGREVRISYLPPLMVYVAFGISSLSAIVGTFFVKEYLGLSAEFLAALGFWVGIPWVLKMPLGHLVDLIWRYKSALVYLGGGIIAASLAIMIGLVGSTEVMRDIMPVGAWYVLSVLLAPIGYVVQDVVADAMTVEAVPRVDAAGRPLDPQLRRLMHTTMQTLGRVAVISGGAAVAFVNIYLFSGVESMSTSEKAAIYLLIYQLALVIPVVSVLGVALGSYIKRRDIGRLRARGYELDEARELVEGRPEPTEANWWILGGSLAFVVFTVGMGLGQFPLNQELIFVGSMGIVLFLMSRLLQVLEPEARRTLVGTAVIIFAYRAVATPGAGETWWMIDVLAFDQQFLGVLALIGGGLTLFGMFIFRRFLAEKSIAYIVVILTIVSTGLSLPIVGMYYGLHEWTAALTGGVVDARFIAIIDIAIESPLGQIAMIPMLAWIANSAPENLKATFFAVMASFANLALSASMLGTKYVNQIFTVTREVKDTDTGLVSIPADYGELGMVLITVTVITLVLPFAAIVLVRWSRLSSA